MSNENVELIQSSTPVSENLPGDENRSDNTVASFVDYHLPEERLLTPRDDDAALTRTPPFQLEVELSYLQLSGSFDTINSDRSKASLDRIPPELFFHITSSLNPRFIIQTLSLVCKKFASIIKDQAIWRIRIAQRFPWKYAVEPSRVDISYHWQDVCIQREEADTMWRGNRAHAKLNDHYADVDSVHLFGGGSMLATGSRDRTINIYSGVDCLEDRPPSLSQTIVGHQGWVWCLDTKNSNLYSGSWDNHLKVFDLAAGGKCVQSLVASNLKSPFLCVRCYDDLLVAAVYNKRLYIYDPRTYKEVDILFHHTKPVLSFQRCQDNYVVSLSEDRTLAIYDLRNRNIYKKIQLPAYGMSSSLDYGQLWIGDISGYIRVFDVSNGLFRESELRPGREGPLRFHSGKITDVVHNLGVMATCSSDRSIHVYSPCQELPLLTRLTGDQAWTSLDLQGRTFAAGCADNSVEVWRG